MSERQNPFEHHFRLKMPCGNCPFRQEGAIHLEPGRLEGIAQELLNDDRSTFQCHKTVHCDRGGDWGDDGKYQPSGHEAMCAGAASYLLAKRRPSVPMRVAFAMGLAKPEDWDQAQSVCISPDSLNAD